MSLYSPGRRRAILVLLLSSVLLITLDLRGNALLDSARSAWIQALRPFESAAEVVARPIRNAWRGITDYDDLEAENERLREQADAQLSNDIKARTVLAENARLRAMQNLESLGDYDRVTSSVIGPSPSNLDQIIEIDSGRDKGVRVGMPVVTSAGFLVGKIHRVFANTAYVLLITDTNYFLNVRIERPADELPEPQFITSTTTTSTTTTTTTIAVDSLAPGAGVATVTTAPSTTSTSTSTTTTTTTTTTTPAAAAGGAVTTSSLVTTTTMVSDPIRETGLLNGQGAGALPLVSLIADTPGFGTPEDGDVVMTAGGTNGLAPPGVLVGEVADVEQGSPSEGLLIHVTPFANVDGLDLVHVILYQPPSEAGSEPEPN